MEWQKQCVGMWFRVKANNPLVRLKHKVALGCEPDIFRGMSERPVLCFRVILM